MTNISANFQIITLSGTMNLITDYGYGGTSGSSVHQIYCLTSGSIIIGAIGGGSSTFPMTGGQTVDVLASTITVSSGTFVGFRSKSQNSYLTPGNPNSFFSS